MPTLNEFKLMMKEKTPNTNKNSKKCLVLRSFRSLYKVFIKKNIKAPAIITEYGWGNDKIQLDA